MVLHWASSHSEYSLTLEVIQLPTSIVVLSLWSSQKHICKSVNCSVTPVRVTLATPSSSCGKGSGMPSIVGHARHSSPAIASNCTMFAPFKKIPTPFFYDCCANVGFRVMLVPVNNAARKVHSNSKDLASGPV